MAKGNMLLGHARGKVGSLVFSRTDGKQIVRAKADVVANPRTEKQMIQRIILQTIAQAYSRTMVITDHSYEAVKEGASCQRFFMQKNMDMLRKKVAGLIAEGYLLSEIYAFSPLKSSVLAINDYVIAKGSLPQVDVVNIDDDSKQAINLTTNTYQGIIDQYGLQRGDQLTFVAIAGPSEEKLSFSYARVILDPTDAEGNELPLTTAFVTNGAIVSPSPRNEGNFTSITYADGKLTFSFNSAFQKGAAVIVSRQSADGTWKRSNASIVANNEANGGYDLQTCLDMISGDDINTLNAQYLNNAGTGSLLESNTGSAGGSTGGDDDDDAPGSGGGAG